MPAEDPRRVEIHLGPLCNNKCVFCVSAQARDDKDPWAALEAVKAELAHFHAKGCRAVGFLGGEPTVYPWIVEAVAHARSLGYTRVALCSNGMRFSDERLCRRLVDAGLTRVTVSLHSRHADVEDRLITLVPGCHARKLQGLRNLLALRDAGALKDNVSLNPVLCRPTMGDMREYLAFVAGLGIDDVRFNYIWPEGDVGEDPSWIPPFREAAPLVAAALAFNERRLRLHLTVGGLPRCALRFAGLSPELTRYLAEKYLDEAAFDPPNDVSIVSESNAVIRPPQRFVWQERKRDQLKRRGPRCAQCRHAARCEGVWKTYAGLYGLDELEPVPA